MKGSWIRYAIGGALIVTGVIVVVSKGKGGNQ